MFHMRPGTKVPLRSRSYKNRPTVEPPGLLRIVAALAIFSVVGVMIYSVFLALAGGAPSELYRETAIYVAILHFLLPIGIAYTVTTNNRISRFLIAAYALILYTATLYGKGVLGGLEVDATVRAVASSICLALIGYWLFLSPKMRFYYSLISHKPIPPDLEDRADRLEGSNWLSSRTKQGIEWFVDHMETVVLLGFMAVAFYACMTAG